MDERRDSRYWLRGDPTETPLALPETPPNITSQNSRRPNRNSASGASNAQGEREHEQSPQPNQR